MSDGRFGIIVDAGLRIKIGDFLIKAPLGGSNRPDAFEQFFKIVFIEAGALLEAFIVQHKTFDDKFFEYLGCPDPKLGSPVAVHAVADGDDRVEVVEIRQVFFAGTGSY